MRGRGLDDTMEQTVLIKTDFIKLDSLLKFAGIAETGGDAKVLVQSGEVSVNGELCTQRGKKIVPGDKIALGDLSFVVGSE